MAADGGLHAIVGCLQAELDPDRPKRVALRSQQLSGLFRKTVRACADRKDRRARSPRREEVERVAEAIEVGIGVRVGLEVGDGAGEARPVVGKLPEPLVELLF